MTAPKQALCAVSSAGDGTTHGHTHPMKRTTMMTVSDRARAHGTMSRAQAARQTR